MEIEAQVSTVRPRTSRVTVASDSITWGENYFIRAVERAAGAMNRRVVSAALSSVDMRGGTRRASNDLENDDLFLEMSMILELETSLQISDVLPGKCLANLRCNSIDSKT